MVERGDGAIVVSGNTSALRGIPGFVGFAPTKASQRILVESVARDLGSKGVHVVYVIIDAAIDMPFARRRFGEGKPDDFFAQPVFFPPKSTTLPTSPFQPARFWCKSGRLGRSGMAVPAAGNPP